MGNPGVNARTAAKAIVLTAVGRVHIPCRDASCNVSPMSLIKSKKRVADHGEVFTPPWLVDAMLDLVKDETDRIDSRFLEPACGEWEQCGPRLRPAGRSPTSLPRPSTSGAHHPDGAVRTANLGLGALLTPVVKGWCAEIGVEVTSLGVQIHGGAGYIEETRRRPAPARRPHHPDLRGYERHPGPSTWRAARSSAAAAAISRAF